LRTITNRSISIRSHGAVQSYRSNYLDLDGRGDHGRRPGDERGQQVPAELGCGEFSRDRRADYSVLDAIKNCYPSDRGPLAA